MSTERIQVSQDFFLPEGLKDASYVDTQLDSDEIPDTNTFEDDIVGDYDGEDSYEKYLIDANTNATEFLQVPKNLTILDQEVRMVTGGSQVVDVVVGFDDVPGATTYEMRITKL